MSYVDEIHKYWSACWECRSGQVGVTREDNTAESAVDMQYINTEADTNTTCVSSNNDTSRAYIDPKEEDHISPDKTGLRGDAKTDLVVFDNEKQVCCAEIRKNDQMEVAPSIDGCELRCADKICELETGLIDTTDCTHSDVIDTRHDGIDTRHDVIDTRHDVMDTSVTIVADSLEDKAQLEIITLESFRRAFAFGLGISGMRQICGPSINCCRRLVIPCLAESFVSSFHSIETEIAYSISSFE